MKVDGWQPRDPWSTHDELRPGSLRLLVPPARRRYVPWIRERTQNVFLARLADDPDLWRLPVVKIDSGWARRRRGLLSDLLHEYAHSKLKQRAHRTVTFLIDGMPVEILLTDSDSHEPPAIWRITEGWLRENRQQLLDGLKLGVAATQRFLNMLRAKARMRQSNELPQIAITETPIQPMAPCALTSA